MIGSRWTRRCGIAVAVAGVLTAGSACEPPPPPSDHIEVTYPTFPDGSPMQAPRQMNQRGEITTCRTGGECYVWRDGEISVIASGDATVVTTDISDKGHVAGTLGPGFHDAFVWRDGELTILPKGDAARASASSVNDHGVVTGRLYSADLTVWEEVVWRDGQLVAMPDHDWARASLVAINNRNQVAMTVVGPIDPENPSEGSARAAIWDVDSGEITELGTLGGDRSSADGINGRGMVMGTSETANGEEHAFLWSHGEMIDVGTLDGGDLSRPNDLNEWGQVAGLSRDADTGEWRAFLWHDGEMTELGPETSQPYPHAINNWGQVAGTIRAEVSGFVIDQAVLWQNGRMANLGDLVPDRFDIPVPTRAEHINDRGQVAGELNLVPISGHDAVVWEVSPTWGYYPDGL